MILFMSKWLRLELVGRGEVFWKLVMELDGMEIERFVVMCEKKDEEDCNKFFMLKIGLKF